MAKKNRITSDPFRPIDGAALSWVVGGRITPRKGMDPAVVQGVTNLAKTIAEVGQVMAAKKQQSDAQMGQMMQQMMAGRGR
jgi:hypothetical protein